MNIRMVNTKGGNFINDSTYLSPNNEHTYRLQKLIDILLSYNLIH